MNKIYILLLLLLLLTGCESVKVKSLRELTDSIGENVKTLDYSKYTYNYHFKQNTLDEHEKKVETEKNITIIYDSSGYAYYKQYEIIDGECIDNETWIYLEEKTLYFVSRRNSQNGSEKKTYQTNTHISVDSALSSLEVIFRSQLGLDYYQDTFDVPVQLASEVIYELNGILDAILNGDKEGRNVVINSQSEVGFDVDVTLNIDQTDEEGAKYTETMQASYIFSDGMISSVNYDGLMYKEKVVYEGEKHWDQYDTEYSATFEFSATQNKPNLSEYAHVIY